MVGKTNRMERNGPWPWSHGSYLFIIGPMGAFVFKALGCLGEEVQITNIMSTGKSAESLSHNSIVSQQITLYCGEVCFF